MSVMSKVDAPTSQLDAALSAIQKDYGEGAIMRLGDTKQLDVETVPTGSLTLDIALGVGGVPKGRVIEIFGPESSGKTTLALNRPLSLTPSTPSTRSTPNASASTRKIY